MKKQKHKPCTVRSMRHALSGCSIYTEHATLRVLLTRLNANIFGLAGSVRMRSNSDNLSDHLDIFSQISLSNSDLFDFIVV